MGQDHETILILNESGISSVATPPLFFQSQSLNLQDFVFFPNRVRTMKISCESCGIEDWMMIINEISVLGDGVIYSTMKCENYGMAYPLQELAKGCEMCVSKDSVIGMLKR
jgi:hypothetical protein